MAFPDSTTLWLFAVAALALLVIPGPAVVYVVTQSAEQGRVAGLASVLGVHLGTLVHVAAAAFGLSAIVLASAVAFSVVKYAGAAYLIYLGIRKLLDRADAPAAEPRVAPLRAVFLRGAFVNVLNPKTALFFLAFVPQFVDTTRGSVWFQVVVLGFLFILLGLVSDGLYAVAGGFIGDVIRRRRTVMRYASGTIYIGLGAAAALAKR